MFRNDQGTFHYLTSKTLNLGKAVNLFSAQRSVYAEPENVLTELEGQPPKNQSSLIIRGVANKLTLSMHHYRLNNHSCSPQSRSRLSRQELMTLQSTVKSISEATLLPVQLGRDAQESNYMKDVHADEVTAPVLLPFLNVTQMM